MGAQARFWSRVNFDGGLPPEAPHLGPCWLWTGPPTGHDYGQVKWHGRPRRAHLVAWLLMEGEPPPAGKELDHLCRRNLCVRHVEPVTRAENQRRSTHWSHLPLGAARMAALTGNPR